jgi:hypothetical protein
VSAVDYNTMAKCRCGKYFARVKAYNRDETELCGACLAKASNDPKLLPKSVKRPGVILGARCAI